MNKLIKFIICLALGFGFCSQPFAVEILAHRGHLVSTLRVQRWLSIRL